MLSPLSTHTPKKWTAQSTMPSSITEIIYPHQEELVRKAIEEAELAFLKAEKARLGSNVTDLDIEHAMARARSNNFLRSSEEGGSLYDAAILGYDPFGSSNDALNGQGGYSFLTGGGGNSSSRPAKRKYVQIPDASDRIRKKKRDSTGSASSSSSPSGSDSTSNSSEREFKIPSGGDAAKKPLQPQKGGKMAAIWADYYNQLVDYKKKFGHVNVSATDPQYKQLAWWLYRQRTAYKSTIETGKGGMTRDRIQLLEALGMVWTTGSGSGGGIRTYQRKKGTSVPSVTDTNAYSSKNEDGEASWMERFQELKEYCRKFGTCNVPLKANAALARWVHRQRLCQKEFRYQGTGGMTIEKVALLESIGIQWES